MHAPRHRQRKRERRVSRLAWHRAFVRSVLCETARHGTASARTAHSAQRTASMHRTAHRAPRTSRPRPRFFSRSHYTTAALTTPPPISTRLDSTRSPPSPSSPLRSLSYSTPLRLPPTLLLACLLAVCCWPTEHKSSSRADVTQLDRRGLPNFALSFPWRDPSAPLHPSALARWLAGSLAALPGCVLGSGAFVPPSPCAWPRCRHPSQVTLAPPSSCTLPAPALPDSDAH